MRQGTRLLRELRQVPAIAEAPRAQTQALDPQELRSRIFVALRELLYRLAERRPVVLVTDDVQWADADSWALLGEVMRPPDAPTLLWIATARGADVRAQATIAGEVRDDAARDPP